MTYSLGLFSKVLETTVKADWHEKHKMLRISFAAGVKAGRADCEIQFGHINRSTKSNTRTEQAQIEMAAHKWVSLSQPGLNFALLNDCKYGYSIRDNIIELNALRGTDYPADNLDFGEHTFRYGIYADDGRDLCQTVRQGYLFNIAPVMVPVESAAGELPAEHSFITLDSKQVIIDGVKKAEESDSLVVRTYEASGAPDGVRVNANLATKVISLCDLTERKTGEVSGEIEYKPFEIVSLLLNEV